MQKRRLTTIAAVTAVVAFAVYGTFAAWTATTSNTGNSIESGDIGIGDDDSGQAMFTIANMEPGDTEVRCIRVTNTGTTGFNSVKLYASPASGVLAGYLDTTIDRGTGATTFPDCTGFTVTDAAVYDGLMADMPTVPTGAITETGTPATGWAAGASKVYRVTVALPSNTPNESAAESASFGLVWDAEVN
jgi:hypothetical protein